MLHVQKWQWSCLWVLTHFQVFYSHSIQDCNTEEKQDSVTHNVYSQQGGARSTAGLAAGCGKRTREEKLQHKTRRPDCTNTPSPSQLAHAATPRPLHLSRTRSTLPKPYGIKPFTRLLKAQSRVTCIRAIESGRRPACRPSRRAVRLSDRRRLSAAVISHLNNIPNTSLAFPSKAH